MMEKPEEIDLPVWWVNGGMWTRRDALEPWHPEHPYNYIKREYGVDPEDYGIFKPNGYEDERERLYAMARADAAGWV